MRSFPFLLQLLFLSQDVFGDDLLSKFHQHGYKLKDVRLQLISFNGDYFNSFEIKAFKFNRTTTAHNMSCNYKVNVGDKIELLVQAYKFLSNEYRHFPARFQINANKGFRSNIGGISNMIKCGNINTENGFNFSKDITYYVCNFVIDETQFPPLIPNGKYKSNVQMLYLEKVIAIVDLFAEVYTPMKY